MSEQDKKSHWAKTRDEAGLMDPIEKGLDGTLSIRGDMRLLMQNADLANIIFEVYNSSELTDWPKGKPPYDS